MHLPVQFNHMTLFALVRNCPVPPEDHLLSFCQALTVQSLLSPLPSIHPARCQPLLKKTKVFTAFSDCYFPPGCSSGFIPLHFDATEINEAFHHGVPVCGTSRTTEKMQPSLFAVTFPCKSLNSSTEVRHSFPENV